MNEKLNKVKKHLRDNKKVYIVAGVTAAVSVGTTVAVMKYKGCIPASEVAQTINQTAIGWKNKLTVVNFIERSTPSKPVHLVGTNLFFSSLSEAARETGHSLAQISRNVNGHIPDVHGDVFEILNRAS